MKKAFLKLFHGIVYIFYIVLFWFLFPISNIFLKKKRIWLINERGYDARDNGFYFFKYIVETHPEIRCYYTIHKKSDDYSKLKQYKNVIEHGSLKHIFLFSCATAKISAQVNGFAPNKYYAKYMLKHHLQGKNIGLKHGIFKNIHPNYFKNVSHLDLIICGAQPEYEFIKTQFGFNEKEVAYCGLARFDGLQKPSTKNQILVMPTFRIPLVDADDETFLKSEYFNQWKSVLDEIDKIVPSGTTVIFYIHAMFQRFAHLFDSKYKNIVVAKFKEYDVQTLLKESKLLVTDFSSVFFDFAYMQKPIVFFQFDEDFFEENHYKKAYFDYRRDGFGRVCVDKDGCLDEIKTICDSNFKMEKMYIDRSDIFFPLRDDKNCERIYDKIVEIL